MMNNIELVVETEAVGERIDKYICENTDLSRSFAEELLENGSCLVKRFKM